MGDSSFGTRNLVLVAVLAGLGACGDSDSGAAGAGGSTGDASVGTEAGDGGADAGAADGTNSSTAGASGDTAGTSSDTAGTSGTAAATSGDGGTIACDLSGPNDCYVCQAEKCCDLLLICVEDSDCGCMAECVGESGLNQGVDGCLSTCQLGESPSGFAPLQQCMESACPDGDECGMGET